MVITDLPEEFHTLIETEIGYECNAASCDWSMDFDSPDLWDVEQVWSDAHTHGEEAASW